MSMKQSENLNIHCNAFYSLQIYVLALFLLRLGQEERTVVFIL